jgi:hypothetical protein
MFIPGPWWVFAPWLSCCGRGDHLDFLVFGALSKPMAERNVFSTSAESKSMAREGV